MKNSKVNVSGWNFISPNELEVKVRKDGALETLIFIGEMRSDNAAFIAHSDPLFANRAIFTRQEIETIKMDIVNKTAKDSVCIVFF